MLDYLIGLPDVNHLYSKQMPRNLSIFLGVAMPQMYTNVMRANFTRKKGTCFAPTSGAAEQPINRHQSSPAAQGLGDCLGVLSRSVSWKCWMYFASADSRPCPEDTGSPMGFQPPVRGPPKMRAG
jgi:hypothetical protein